MTDSLDASENKIQDSESEVLNEHDILMYCALRIDGYKCAEAIGYDLTEGFERYIGGGLESLSLLERFTVFFMLQRYLFKWGGERLPHNGPEWKTFRSLFLVLCEIDAPTEYPPIHSELLETWNTRYRPRIREVKEFIRRKHTRTKYCG